MRRVRPQRSGVPPPSASRVALPLSASRTLPLPPLAGAKLHPSLKGPHAPSFPGDAHRRGAAGVRRAPPGRRGVRGGRGGGGGGRRAGAVLCAARPPSPPPPPLPARGFRPRADAPLSHRPAAGAPGARFLHSLISRAADAPPEHGGRRASLRPWGSGLAEAIICEPGCSSSSAAGGPRRVDFLPRASSSRRGGAALRCGAERGTDGGVGRRRCLAAAAAARLAGASLATASSQQGLSLLPLPLHPLRRGAPLLPPVIRIAAQRCV